MDKDIDDTHRALHEAAARFLNGLERDDLDKVHQAMTDVAASLREVLEHIAAECRLSYDEMCVIAMVALSSMVEDASQGHAAGSHVRLVVARFRNAGGSVDGAALP